MPFAFPNTGNKGENNNSNNEGFSSSNYVLKDDIKNDWYMYRAADKSVVRPYPVYDASGSPCGPVGDIDPQNQFSIFSEAFAIVPLVVYAGLDGKLQFIDYCPDIDSYAAPGTVLTKTPYNFFVTAMRELLPEKDSTTTRSGLLTPPRLLSVQKNIHYAATSLMFRGAMVKVKGKGSTSKHAVDGVMFKSVVFVSVKSAISSLITELQKPKDPRQPWSPQNSVADGLFELDGLTIQFDKPGSSNSDPYQVQFGYDPGYVQAAAKFFNIGDDPAQYHSAVRAMFGANQQISDIFRLLTVGELVSILKEKYPISWVYYALKDSPYASLLTPDDREAALRDPEMAPWFGLAPSSGTSSPTAHAPQQIPSAPAYPQSVPSYPQAAPTYPSAATPQYGGQPVNQPVNRPAPDFVPPTYTAGTPMGPATAAPAPGSGNDAMARMQFYQNKYKAAASADTLEDGLKY